MVFDDLRGQGGGNRDSHSLPNEGLAQAKYAAALDHQSADSPVGKRPSLVERLKRWFSTRF
jgi:hypothetical protein